MISEKNILIVSKSSQPGGLEYHVLDLIKGFSKANNVYVFVPPGPLVENYENEGAEVITVYPKSPLDLDFVKKVYRFCKKNRIHIIHTHELISSPSLISAFFAGVKKRIYHVHTPFLKWQYSNTFKKILKTVPNWIMNFTVANLFSTDVIALTPGIKRHRIFFELIFSSKIKVVPNAFNFKKYSKKISGQELHSFKNKYGIPGNKKIIGNISRLTKEKGHIYLLKAFKKLNDKFPEKYFLLLAGGGELEPQYRSFCENNFPDSYLITGKFPEKDKLLILNSIDYFVFPSLAEGFGYVPLEAMAAKRPLICSDLEVLRYVTGNKAYYFKRGSSKDLYNTLEEVLNLKEDALQNKVGQAYNKVKNYSFDAFVKNYSSIYEGT